MIKALSKFLSVIIFLVLSFTVYGQHQLTVRLKIPFVASGPNASYFLMSEYNNWNPLDTNYLFKKINGIYQLTFIYKSPYWLQYKITRGSVQSQESNAQGYGIANRLLNVTKDTTIDVAVEGWTDLIIKQHTFTKGVRVVSDNFPIKSLNRTCRVWIYLPPSYHKTQSRYPVIYMQDGDELFDKAATDDGKEWRADEMLDSLYKKKGTAVIVVAVASSDKYRGTEYSGYPLKTNSIYEGREYMTFITKELIPYINKHYRTKTESVNTSIGGCSMGGLISLYGILHYPQYFGSAAVLSPAFWNVTSLDSLNKDISYNSAYSKSKILLYGGDHEGVSNRLEVLKEFSTLLSTNPQNQIKLKITKGGQHGIPFWSEPFMEFVEWVYSKNKNDR